MRLDCACSCCADWRARYATRAAICDCLYAEVTRLRAFARAYLNYRFECSDTPGATKRLDKQLYELDDMASELMK